MSKKHIELYKQYQSQLQELLDKEEIINDYIKTSTLELKHDIKKLREKLNFLYKLIKNKIFLDKYIIDELIKTNNEVDKKITQRRSQINTESISDILVNVEEFQEIEKLTIVLFKDGSLKCFRSSQTAT